MDLTGLDRDPDVQRMRELTRRQGRTLTLVMVSAVVVSLVLAIGLFVGFSLLSERMGWGASMKLTLFGAGALGLFPPLVGGALLVRRIQRRQTAAWLEQAKQGGGAATH